MTRRFSQTVPKSPLELERFYLDTIDKLGNTGATLADEEQKSLMPILGMVQALDRRIEALSRSNRILRVDMESFKRVSHENRMMKAQISELAKRIENIEGEL